MSGQTKLLLPSGGSLQLQAADSAQSNIVTFPARSGNVAVDGPCFRASQSAPQLMSNSTDTIVLFDVETDPYGVYSPATGKYLPALPGWHHIDTSAQLAGSGISNAYLCIIINGTSRVAASSIACAFTQFPVLSTGGCFYLANTTDYVQVLAYTTASGGSNSVTGVNFSAHLVRAA